MDSHHHWSKEPVRRICCWISSVMNCALVFGFRFSLERSIYGKAFHQIKHSPQNHINHRHIFHHMKRIAFRFVYQVFFNLDKQFLSITNQINTLQTVLIIIKPLASAYALVCFICYIATTKSSSSSTIIPLAAPAAAKTSSTTISTRSEPSETARTSIQYV